MNTEIEACMRSVRDYYVKGDRSLTTQEVIDRIYQYAGTTPADWMRPGETRIVDGLMLDLNLEAFNRHREEANLKWGIGAEKPVTSHRPVLGRFIVLFKKSLRKMLRWYINPIIEAQNDFNAQATGALNELYNKLIAIQGNFEQIHQRSMNTDSRIQSLSEDIEQRMEDADETAKERQEILCQELTALQKRMETEFSYYAFKIKSMEHHRMISADKNKAEASTVCPAAAHPSPGLDYFLFENRFRGSESQIKENLSQYLPYFSEGPVLDIGCGRGEFLELLEAKGLEALGVDIYPDFAAYCQSKGLKVTEADAVSYLEQMPDNALGGIFLAQVVEHLTQEYLMRLLALSHRKLKKGAWFVAETPNPAMLSTLSNSFYLDLSHERPIHPEAMRFLLEYCGFESVDIVYSKPSKIPYDLPLLEGDEHIQNLQAFNDGVSLLNGLLFGCQDYAAAGCKGGAKENA